VGCLALLTVTVPLTALLRSLAVPDPVTVAVAGPSGLIVYGLVVRSAFPAAWNDLRTVVMRVFPVLARIGRGESVTAPAVAP
jgi:hypothetical protein